MKNVYDIKREKNLNFILPLEQTERSSMEDIYSKTVVLIHLHYVETVDIYMEYIRNIPAGIDIIFTVSEQAVKEKILLSIKNIENKYYIIEKNNRGRDISALLVAGSPYILKYEYFCFLHDKRAKEAKIKPDVERWIQCLWENMLGSRAYIDNILDVFKKQETIGLLAAPAPMSPYFDAAFSGAWSSNFKNTKRLAERLQLVCDLNEEKPVLTIGTAFWAKKEALRKLLEEDWKYEDFDAEPMAVDGTISHAIERCFAYVAQDAGYETGIVMTDRFAGERMDYMQNTLRTAFSHLSEAINVSTIAEIERYDILRNELSSAMSADSYIYIYGAGVYGRQCADWVKSWDYQVRAFLVTSKEGTGQQYLGIPVVQFSEIELDENAILIIAVSEKYKREIMEEIEKGKGIAKNILSLL